MNQNKEQMHPDDMRNLLIFAVVALILYYGYDTFIGRPQQEALQKAQAQQELVLKAQKQAPIQDPSLQMKPRKEVIAEAKRISFDNGEIKGTIDLKGGRIDDMSFQKYFETIEKQTPVSVLSPRESEHPRYVDYGWVSNDQNLKLPNDETIWSISGNEKLTPENPVTLAWNNGQGLRFERTISLDDRYMFKVEQSVKNNTGHSVSLFPYALISQTGEFEHNRKSWISHEGPMGYIGKELVQVTYAKMKDLDKNTYQSDSGWAGITDKYWLTALIPTQAQTVKYRFNYVEGPVVAKGEPDRSRYQVDMMGSPVDIAQGNSATVTTNLFVGAKEVSVLSGYQKDLGIPNFDLAVDFGWFWFMTMPFFYALHFLYHFVGNFGVAILLLTLAIRTAVFPLTNLSYVSFAKMKKVAPQMTELREKHKEDKQALQQAIMELYQKEGVNPLSGCLPILLQIPIFFSLYKVLFNTLEMRHAPFWGWIQDLSAPDPTSIFNLFGLVDWTPPSMLIIGAWPCAMLVVMLIQRQLNPPPQDPIQRDMMRFFPFIMTFVMAKFAAGLVMYWTFSALLSVAQQMIIMKRLGVPIHLFGETDDEKKLDKQVAEGPAVHPLAEMAEEEIEDAMFGSDQPAKPISKPKPKKNTPKKGKKKK